MPKKKRKSERFFYKYGKACSGAVLLTLIVLVGYAVLHSNNVADATVTAPAGTTARSDQIDASEMREESGLDGDYDNQQIMNAQSDASSISQVEDVVPDEN